MPAPATISGTCSEISYIFSGRVLLPLPKKPLMPDGAAMIGGVDDDGIAQLAAFVQRLARMRAILSSISVAAA